MLLKLTRFAVFSIVAAFAGWLAMTMWMESRRPLPVAAREPSGVNGWFDRMRPHCNAVEVETAMQRLPPDLTTVPGVGFAAACLALAGSTDSAGALILTLPSNARVQATAIVFDVGHPVADMGDDRSAGPIMELVVRFWPNHYMALYHAGASAYQLGHHARAQQHLEAFLGAYTANDGWTSAARGMLGRMHDDPQATPRPVEDPHQ